MNDIRVVLVDDHTLFRAGLRLLLNDVPEIEVAGEATTGHEALQLAAEIKPEILLLDLSLPNTSGIALLKEIKRCAPETGVIILTMHNDAAMVRAALAAGAKGYVVKTAADTVLITAIHSVAGGRTFVDVDLPRDQLGTLLDEVPAGSRTNDGPLGRLSKRERQVFEQLALGHTNKEIANDLDVSVKTVETYRARIGEKFGLRSRADLIRFAIEAGVLAPGSGDG